MKKDNLLYIALLVVAFFVPYEIDFKHHGLNLPIINTNLEMLGVALILIWFGLKLINKEYRIASTPLDLPLVVFMIWHIITSLTAYHSIWAVKYTFKLAGGVLLYYIVVDTIKDKKQLRTLILVLIGSSIIVSILGIGERLFLDKVKNILDVFCPEQFVLPEGMTVRAKATFFYPNTLAGYVSAIIFIISGLILSERKPGHLKALIVVLALVAEALMLTYSRGGLLGAYGALGLLIWVCYSRDYLRVNLRKAVLIGAIVSGMLLFTTVFDSALGIRIRNIFDPNYNANVERMYFFKSSLDVSAKNPVTGVGPDCFRWVYDVEYAKNSPFDSTSIIGGLPSGNSHNIYLEVLATLGVPGFLIFLWFIIRLIGFQKKVILRMGNIYTLSVFLGLSAAVWTFFVHGLVDCFWQFQSMIFLFWLILGMMVAAGKIHNTD